MTTTPTTTSVPLPAELVQTLQAEAKAMGLDLPAYLLFLHQCRLRGHDEKFVDAAKHTFSKYPETLRKLAQ